MRVALLLVAMFACRSSSPSDSSAKVTTPGLAIVGYGVQIVPAPATSASVLENGVLIFGPRADAPLPANVKNVAVKPGKPPTAPLTPHATAPVTMYSDGASDTTAISTGVGMASFQGVLTDVVLSQRTGVWTIVFDGRDQAWPQGQRLDVGDDGRSFKLVAK
jgi:hypothetical protein